MISLAYINQQLGAVIRIVRNREWQNVLDMTADGVFRSFWALPLSIPFAIASHLMTMPVLKNSPNYELLEIPTMPVWYTAGLRVVEFLVAWALALFLIAGLSQQLQAGRKVTPLIVSYNWSVLLLQILIFIGVLFIVPTGAYDILLLHYLVMTMVWFYVRWCLIRQTLESPLAATIGIMVMVFLATYLTSTVITDLGHNLFRTLFETNTLTEGTMTYTAEQPQ